MAQESPSPADAVRSQPEPVRFPGQRSRRAGTQEIEEVFAVEAAMEVQAQPEAEIHRPAQPGAGQTEQQAVQSAISGWNRVRQNNPVR